MKIKYGTLIDYTYFVHQYDALIKQNDSTALARFISQNPGKLRHARDFRQKILSFGALDPAAPQAKSLVGTDLYHVAIHNDILYYPVDIKYIHNTIHNDNVYRILPNDPYFAAQFGDYMIEKLVVNYEYFLNNTTPPPSTKRALICIISDLMNFASAINPSFRIQFAQDYHFIQRWFEKIR